MSKLAEFKALLAEYSASLREVKLILDPQARPATKVDGRSQRRERSLNIYVNPNNNERVEIKGGNHKGLKGCSFQVNKSSSGTTLY